MDNSVRIVSQELFLFWVIVYGIDRTFLLKENFKLSDNFKGYLILVAFQGIDDELAYSPLLGLSTNVQKFKKLLILDKNL